MYEEQDDSRNALKFYRQADLLQSNDYYTLKALLDLEVSLNEKTYQDRTQQFFLLAPSNPTIYQDLLNIYLDYHKENELLAFLASQHKSFSTDNKVNGNLYLYKVSSSTIKKTLKMQK